MDNLTEAQIFQSVLMEYKGVPVILTTIMGVYTTEYWYHLEGYGVARLALGVDRKTPRPSDGEIINNINFEELEKDF